MENLYVLILGIIEGLTEFLPISSTGHTILGTTILGTKMDDFWWSFLIIIQLGSVLAALFVSWRKLLQSFILWFKLAFVFLPTGLIELFMTKHLELLFNGYVVVFMLILGGVVFIGIELWHRRKSYVANSLDEVSFKQAFCIGLIQSLVMIPGTSRSGASIIGGLSLGLNRKVAAESSFLLAMPTMMTAMVYSIYKEPSILSSASSFTPLLIGFVMAFMVAALVIKFFLKFIARFDFIPFGIYRVVLGILFFYLYVSGILDAGSEFEL